MRSSTLFTSRLYRETIACAWVWFLLLGALCAFAPGQQAAKPDVLRIGTSAALTAEESGGKEAEAIDTLQSLIKSETGFDSEILRQKDWAELADKMATGPLQLGVFQGYEFAWAKEKYPKLQPLVLAVNGYPHRDAYVIVRQDNKATDFAGLQGQVISLPRIAQGQLRLFVEWQSEAQGKRLEAFFARITSPDNVEDALDDVVDNVVQAAVVERVSLEAYKRRKPGRFLRLKELAHSQPFPPPVVAYYNDNLDKATLQRFRDGLLNTGLNDKGQRLLTLFKLTGFEAPPANLDQMLTTVQKAYPPPIRRRIDD
jgi:ABC-type phosphate/phosphonate transport system substrate-binding protein